MNQNNFDLSINGAQELTEAELRQIQGGNWLTDAVGSVAHAVSSAVNDVGHAISGAVHGAVHTVEAALNPKNVAGAIDWLTQHLPFRRFG